MRQIFRKIQRAVMIMAPFLSLFTVSETMAETKKRSNTFATPDFAYPETVERNARTAFDKASASGDNIDMMRAAIQLTLAKSMVDKSTSKANIALRRSITTSSIPTIHMSTASACFPWTPIRKTQATGARDFTARR